MNLSGGREPEGGRCGTVASAVEGGLRPWRGLSREPRPLLSPLGLRLSGDLRSKEERAVSSADMKGPCQEQCEPGNVPEAGLARTATRVGHRLDLDQTLGGTSIPAGELPPVSWVGPRLGHERRAHD